MKITIEHYNETITIERPDELCIEDIPPLFRKICYCLGFHHNNINDYILDTDQQIPVTVENGEVTCESPFVQIINKDADS